MAKAVESLPDPKVRALEFYPDIRMLPSLVPATQSHQFFALGLCQGFWWPFSGLDLRMFNPPAE